MQPLTSVVPRSAVAASVAVLAAGAVDPEPAHAQPLRPLFTTAATDAHAGVELPTGAVPGIAGRRFTSFGRPRSSPDAATWGFVGFTDTGDAATDEVLVIVGAAAQSAVIENVTTLADGSGETVRSMNQKFGINDDGCYAVQSDTSGPPGTGIVAKGCDGEALDVVARTDEAIPGLGAVTYIGFEREPNIDNLGRVWFGFDTSEPVATNGAIFRTLDGTQVDRIVQEGVTTFAARDGQRTFETLDNEFSNARGGLQVSGDGAHVLVRGDFGGDTASDDFLGLDGAVLLQEGFAATATLTSPLAANNPVAVVLSRSGSWIARATNAAGQSFVLRDGQVVALSGETALSLRAGGLPPGSLAARQNGEGEIFTDFNIIATGLDGDHVIGGRTDLADQQVLAYFDGSRLRPVARQGDDVDLDGDGSITAIDARVFAFSSDGVLVRHDETAVASVILCKDPCASTPDFIGPALIEVPLREPVTGPLLTITKVDTLLEDNDGDDEVSGGDLVSYGVAITNVGGAPATNVTLGDDLDPNTVLRTGTVTATRGTIDTGNARGDLRVGVSIGTLGPGENVVITYAARINRTVDRDFIANQAIVAADGLGGVSDDPDTPAPGDPTRTPIGPGPAGQGATPILGGPPDGELFCKGLPVTIAGTPQSDMFAGTNDDDVIHGLGGSDVIDGLGGNDVICGGPGNDLLVGGAGNDLLCGDQGADRLQGDTGDDVLRGETGDDALLGGANDDTLHGGSGDDDLAGGDGDDVLRGKDDLDFLLGGTGEDSLRGGDDADYLDGGAGADRLFGGDHADDLYGGTENDGVNGGLGDDLGSGGPGDDFVIGKIGDDILSGDLGNDDVLGGFGNDQVVGGPDEGDDPGADIDRVAGGPGNDDLRGGLGDDTIDGGQGDDDIDGGSDDDDCDGGIDENDTAVNCETVVNVP
jgi:uncharacterized repeat protein (TIGR01451 family)